MHVSADSIFFPADHKGDLTVSLQSHKSVYNVSSRFFKAFRPLDIVLFVKAGFKLYKRSNILAVCGCFLQSLYYRGITRHSVKGDLYGQGFRIF